MIRGCQKKAVYVKNTGSPLFEGAYFIVKDKYASDEPTELNIISEANRIIEENSDLIGRKRGFFARLRRGFKKLTKNVPLFLFGVIIGIIIGFCIAAAL